MITSYNFALASYQLLDGAVVKDTFFLPETLLAEPSGGATEGVLMTQDNAEHTRFLSNAELLSMGFATVALFTAQFDADKLSVQPLNAANPSGAADYIQFSDGANFASSIDLQFDDTAKILSIGNGTNTIEIKPIGGGATSPNVVIGAATSGAALLAGGEDNVILGNGAGATATTGDFNVFIGNDAGANSTTARNGVAIGNSSMSAGAAAITGHSNVCIGENTGLNIQGAAAENVIIGRKAGSGGTFVSAIRNTIVGYDAGHSMTTGDYNCFLGSKAGYGVTTGGNNICLGKYSGYGFTNATDNIFIGRNSGYNATGGGSQNIAIGVYAGDYMTSGTFNTFIGYMAGKSNAAGTSNVAIGWYANGSNTAGNNVVAIGYAAGDSNTASNKLFIGAISGRSLISGDFTVGQAEVERAFVVKPVTAIVASALTPEEGLEVNVSTTDATFTSTGKWIYEGGAWAKFTVV